jgi:hypothetical protein
MMDVVGVSDFSLKDLIKPEPERVALILSGLINFGKFREMQLANLDHLTDKAVRRVRAGGRGHTLAGAHAESGPQDQLAQRKATLEQETAALKEQLETMQYVCPQPPGRTLGRAMLMSVYERALIESNGRWRRRLQRTCRRSGRRWLRQ